MALVALPAFAQEHKYDEHHEQDEHHDQSGINEFENTKVSGEIRKIDIENNKIAIKHQEIKKYNMAAMTMNIRLKAANQLDGLQPGDKVRFIPDTVDGGYVLRTIEKAE